MIGHVLSPRKKIAAAPGAPPAASRIDALVVYSTAQRDLAVDELGVPVATASCCHRFMVDTDVLSRPTPSTPAGRAR